MATLALHRNTSVQLIAKLNDRMIKTDIPDEEIISRAARNIREQASTLYQLRRSLRSVERAMELSDHDQLQPLLEEIADIVSPETVGEEVVTHRIFLKFNICASPLKGPTSLVGPFNFYRKGPL